VTVCVAAISENSGILAMADRMLTASIHQYQPARAKIVPVTASIIAMYAGDANFAIELIEAVKAEVKAGIDAKPTEWWGVQATAEVWQKVYLQRRRREAELAYLAPFDLTTDSFLARQQQLSQSFVNKLTGELAGYSLPDVEVIFAGLDSAGAHLYCADGADVNCYTARGWAAIGIGAFHARSEFINSRHLASDSWLRVIYTTYVAKKRAESAPGVGSETDSRIIWALGKSDQVRTEIMDTMQKAFADSEKKVAKQRSAVEAKVKVGIEAITNPPQPPPEPTPAHQNAPIPPTPPAPTGNIPRPTPENRGPSVP